jgi:hypothetical protein
VSLLSSDSQHQMNARSLLFFYQQDAGLIPKTLLACLIIIGATNLGTAQAPTQPGESETGFIYDKGTAADKGEMVRNGRSWRGLDKQSKIMLLVGIAEGAVLMRRELFVLQHDGNPDLQRAFDNLTISGFKYSDITAQVDTFYSDSANLRIPVIEAYKHVVARMKGASTSELERSVTALRQTYNQ